MKKRLLSLLLVLAVVFSFSLSAFATDTGIDIIDDPLSYYFENQMWDKTINGINRYGLFFADSLGEVLWHDPVFLFYLTITIVGLVALGVIRALTS